MLMSWCGLTLMLHAGKHKLAEKNLSCPTSVYQSQPRLKLHLKEHSPCLCSEEHITMEGDVMWVGSGSRRNGYLLFNCATLEDPPKDTMAHKYTMTFKFSQVSLRLVLSCVYSLVTRVLYVSFSLVLGRT